MILQKPKKTNLFFLLGASVASAKSVKISSHFLLSCIPLLGLTAIINIIRFVSFTFYRLENEQQKNLSSFILSPIFTKLNVISFVVFVHWPPLFYKTCDL